MLRQFSENYDYCLSEEQLKQVHNELACEGVFRFEDIIELFEIAKEKGIC